MVAEKKIVNIRDPLFFAFCGYVAVSPLVNAALYYWQGWRGRWVPGVIPVTFFVFLLVMGCVLGALFLIYRDFESWKKVRGKAAILLVAVGICLGVKACLPVTAESFLDGFRDRILARVPAAQLEKIASEARKVVPKGKALWSPEKSGGMDEKSLAKWREFAAAVDLRELNESFLVVLNRDETIVLSWGWSMTGHWGLRIAPAGEKPVKDREIFREVPVYEGVTAFYGD